MCECPFSCVYITISTILNFSATRISFHFFTQVVYVVPYSVAKWQVRANESWQGYIYHHAADPGDAWPSVNSRFDTLGSQLECLRKLHTAQRGPAFQLPRVMSTMIGVSKSPCMLSGTGQEQDPLSAFVLRLHQLPDNLHRRAKAGWFHFILFLYKNKCWK